jgi:subtilisin-like proprotein convertase family protein
MINIKSSPLLSAMRRAIALASVATASMLALPSFAVETGCVASGGTNCAALIPDGPQTGLVSSLTVPAGICGGSAPTGVSVRVNATHSWIGDLTIAVKNPANTTVTLIDQLQNPPSTSCAGDDVSATFQDGGAAATCAAATVPSLSGIVAPASALAPLAASATGVWTLTVTDNVNGNNGALNDWAVDVACAPLGPADMAVALSGFPAVPVANTSASGTITCSSIGLQAALNVTCSVLNGTTSGCALQPGNTPIAAFPVASVAVGQSITCSVSTPVSAAGVLSVTGLTSATIDSNAANNTATYTATNAPPLPADMSVALSGFPTVPVANSTASGTVTCSNVGGQAALNATCSVTGGTTSACTVQPGNTPVATFPVASLAAGQSITCNVSAPVSSAGVLSVTGLTSATNDTNLANNSAQYFATVAQAAPIPTPTLSSISLLLLMLALVGFASFAIRGRRA